MTLSPEGFHLFLQGFALLLGLVFGSFLNVCIGRLPEDRSVVHPPSHCPSCGHRIRPWENVPVLSWVLLRARCSGCGGPISALYPTIELLTGVLALLLFRHLVPGFADVSLVALVAFGLHLVFVCMLIVAFFVDLRHFIIPLEVSWYAIPTGVAAVALLDWMGWPGASWQQSVAGVVFGGGVLWAVLVAYELIRKEKGMGEGDVGLLAMMGGWLGALPGLPFVVVVGSVLGSVVGIALMVLQGRGLRTEVPFGPFLALAGLLYVFFGPLLTRPWRPMLELLGLV